jgi:protein-disulfide isomerase
LLASADVVVQEVEVADRGDLHRRYNVEAVPTLVVADREGVVRASFVGPPPEAELAAAIADARGVET